ncbi:replication-associated protein [Human lung-associated brisavirus AA]|uniref:Replication-associated protein n=1 Tax=Human lung-associated brisavirus AA TaxID=2571075 RepID=A0A4D6K391_9VIRU|nr:replication-associated protein [Human lung-associated brisavirus AA]
MNSTNVSKPISGKNFLLTYNDSEDKIGIGVDIAEHLIEKFQEKVLFIAVGREIAPTTGMIHYHCLLMLKDRFFSRNTSCFDFKNIHPNFQTVRNNTRKTYLYVIKDNDYWETNPRFFEKEDDLKNKERIRKNKLLMEGDIMKAYLDGEIGPVELIRAQKIRAIKLQTEPTMIKREAPLVIWFYGKTGTGKTRKTIEMAEELKLKTWMSSDSLKWFDGYCNQELAIIDDLRKEILPNWAFLLRLLDRYALIVQIKGGFTRWNPKIIIITSPVEPHECFSWFNRQGEQQAWDSEDQLLRRLTWDGIEQVYEFPLSTGDEEALEETLESWKAKQADEEN